MSGVQGKKKDKRKQRTKEMGKELEEVSLAGNSGVAGMRKAPRIDEDSDRT